MNPKRLLCRMLSVGVAGLLFAGSLAATVCPPVDPGIQSVYQDFARLQSSLQMARSELDTRRIDPAALQASIGADPDDLLAWVREETRWLDYEGSLRGASGVLLDHMGSSLDRSLLLAELLGSAGHRVRLARGPLTDADLARLLEAHGGTLASIEPNLTLNDAELRTAAEAFGLSPSDLREEFASRQQLWQRTRDQLASQTNRQADALGHALGHTLGEAPNGLAPGTVTSARQHWWVQVQADGRWRDLDPALPDLASGDTLVGASTDTLTVDELEPEQHHRLTLRVVAEQWNNGRLREHLALEESFNSAALAWQQLRIDLVPTKLPSVNDWMTEVPDQLPAQIHSADEWLPVLRIGSEAITDQMILIDGSVRPADGEPVQARAMQGAASALGGISLSGRRAEREAPSTELSAVHLQLVIQAPGRGDVTLSRPLMDVIGPSGREQRRVNLQWDDALRAERAVGLLGHLQIQAQPAWLNETAVAWQRYGAMLDDRLAAMAVLDAQAHDRYELMEQALESRSILNDALLGLAQMRSMFSPEQPRIAMTELNLLAWFEEIRLEDELPTSLQGFDILHNPVAVLGTEDSEQATVRLRQGVFDTVLEAWIIDNDGAYLADNTSRHFERSLAMDDPGVWLRDSSDISRLSQALPEDTLSHLKQVIDQGRTVVLIQAPNGLDSLSWWEIDPVTGTTLGYGPNRRGQASEGVMMFWNALNNARSAVGMVHAVWECLFKHGSAPGMQCCIRETAMKEALNRFISKGFSEYAKVTGLTLASGGVLIDTLNAIAIGDLGGRFTNAMTGALEPGANCPDRRD
ncbi:MAG: hypothetical protein ACXIUB_04100 [Wenzhouxiangella sp.]